MRVCDFVEISTDIRYWSIYQDKKAFCVLIHILLNRDCDTNSVEIFNNRIDSIDLKENDIKKALFKLKKENAVELYRGSRKNKTIVALRRNDDMYKIGDYELYLDDSLIIPIPKTYGRNDKGYSTFRNSVLKRDKYECQMCGSKIDLEVHHKKSYAEHPRLRTSVSNGITLCKICHNKVHSKGELN